MTMWHNTYPAEPYGVRGLYIYQPLATTAPADAQPYCYLFNRIAFYKQPYEVDASGGYARWDELTHEWNLLGQRWTDDDIGWSALAPFVDVDGVLYELASAEVIRRDDAWVLRWLAWCVRADDRRLVVMATAAAETADIPLNTRVATPHGIGVVVAYSRLRHSKYVVEYPSKDRKLYRADELATIAPQKIMGVPLP